MVEFYISIYPPIIESSLVSNGDMIEQRCASKIYLQSVFWPFIAPGSVFELSLCGNWDVTTTTRIYMAYAENDADKILVKILIQICIVLQQLSSTC